MSLQNQKRRFGGLIIWLSKENMKNFNFPLKHWCWINIINTTGWDPLFKLGRCYPIEINNGRVKSTHNNVIFWFTPSSVKFTTCLHQLQSQINTGTSFDTIVAQCQHLWVWPSIEVASVLNLTPLELSLNPS